MNPLENLPEKLQLVVRAPSSHPIAGVTPFSGLGVECKEGKILSIHYLPVGCFEKVEAKVEAPDLQSRKLVGDLEGQLLAYFDDPASVCFDDLRKRLCAKSVLPFGNPEQRHKMRETVCGISCGGVLAYGDVASKSAGLIDRNVATACGENQIGIIVPCFRVVRKRSGIFYLGEYSRGNPHVKRANPGRELEIGREIKCWLLRHEGCEVAPPQRSPNKSDLSRWKVRPKSP